MNRRRALATLGGIAFTAAAGCLSAPANDGNGSPTDTTTETPGTDSPTETSPTDSPTPTTPVLADTTFEILDNRPDERLNEATVTVEDGAVVVTGTIFGSNGCYTARLADAVTNAGRLTVTVESYEDTGDGTPACTQAIVAIDYRLTATFEGSLPTAVEVRHDTPDGTDVVATKNL